MGNPDVMSLSKNSFKKIVRKYINFKNRSDLLELIKPYKKLDYKKCLEETFERKPYFFTLNLDQTRRRFRVSNNMVQGFRKNYPRKYKGKSLSCQYCLKMKVNSSNNSSSLSQVPDDHQHHAYECPAYLDLHDKFDIKNSDIDVVEFFRIILERRGLEGEE